MTRRVAGDGLYEHHQRARWTTVKERRPFAERLRATLGAPPT